MAGMEVILDTADTVAAVPTEERLLQISYFDTLTGAYNRALFEQVVRTAIASDAISGTGSDRGCRRGFALLDLDIDRFRLINEAFGQEFGNTVLRDIVRRLSTLLGPDDTLARIASDEFGIVLADTTEGPDLDHRIETVLNVVAEPISIENTSLSVSASIGVSIYPQDGSTAEALFRHAGAALARARTLNARKYQRETGSSEAKARELLVLESHLRTVVRQRALTVHFQPQVDLRNGVLSGAEALVRWTDPVLGAVPPDRFIPLAETTGLIPAVGEFVLRIAVGQWATWRRAHGLAAPLAVNLSAIQFIGDTLEPLVASVLRENELPPDLLDLELTETALLSEARHTRGVMDAIQVLGVRFSLDDFGTGYSSLSHLHQFPISRIKIDKSFTARLTEDRAHEKIVRAIIMLAHELDLTVVAEGVETETQRALLAEMGCDYGQGYLFDRALSPEEFERRWLAA